METENRKIIFIRFFAMIAALVVTIGLVGCRRDGAVNLRGTGLKTRERGAQ